MLIEQPPSLLRRLYPRAEWREDPSVHAVYLTFDDGPIPGMTPWVLDVLDSFGVKATFFLVGDNIRKHPAEFEMVFLYYLLAIFIWLSGIVLEGVISRIAGKILKLR